MEDKDKKNNGSAKPPAKISLTEVVLITPILIISDGADVLANFSLAVPVLGEITGVAASFANLTIALSLQFYLIMKGIYNVAFLTGGLIDVIPVANALPAKTAGWITLVIMVNNPKAGKIASLASGKVTGLMKK